MRYGNCISIGKPNQPNSCNAQQDAKKGDIMEIQFRSRNHDMGACFPTFQERVNSMLPAGNAETAPQLEPMDKNSITPHYPTNEEIARTMAEVEEMAAQESQELVQIHSGLNEQRVARLLGLLD